VTQAHWLWKRREELNLSQEELAARLQIAGFNISRASLSNWENGKANPPLHDPIFRKALADALQVSRRNLLELAGYEVSGTTYSEPAERAADLIETLPPTDQEFVLNFINWYWQQEQIKRSKDKRY
jgi:transcriptional regulator with XRE-family HTH domain